MRKWGYFEAQRSKLSFIRLKMNSTNKELADEGQFDRR